MPVHIQLRTRLCVLVVCLVALAACASDGDPERVSTVSCPPGMTRAAQQDICIHDLCGNGTIDTGEGCDDGNRIAGDGCSPDCQSAEVCGNGIVDDAVGEVCDDGNTASNDHCCSDCRSCPELATRPPVPSSPEPQAPVSAECTQLQQALAEAAAARARAALESARANQEADRARAALQSAGARARAAAPEAQRRAQVDDDLARALGLVAELERANAALEQAIAAERLQLAKLRPRLASGRSAELQ